MRVSLVHPSLNRIGGAEAVFLEMKGALQGSGHKVTTFTLDKVDWERIGEEFGYNSAPDDEKYFLKGTQSTKNSFVNLLHLAVSYLWLLLCAKKSGDDLVINNYGEIFPTIANISYAHAIPLINFVGEGRDNPYQIPFWRIISRLYALFYAVLERTTEPSITITNSRYNAEMIKRRSRLDPLVLHPPVDPSRLSCEISGKDNVILTISRINAKKNLTIIPEIAEKMDGEFEFVIMGRTDGRSKAVIKDIRDSSSESRVADRLKIILEPDRRTIEGAFRKASVYLSTQPNEAFGMALVEAMAAGCVPVVPRDGGPWFDILDERQGWFGFSFTDPGHAARLIRGVLSNDNLRRQVGERARRRAMAYTSERFRRKFLELIDGFQGSRR